MSRWAGASDWGFDMAAPYAGLFECPVARAAMVRTAPFETKSRTGDYGHGSKVSAGLTRLYNDIA